MSNRVILSTKHTQYMRKISHEVETILNGGGMAYETKSAIWAYSPTRNVVTLFVKNPQPNMSNDWIEYSKDSKNFYKHLGRIIRLTQAAT